MEKQTSDRMCGLPGVHYPDTQLYIDGIWRTGASDTAVLNPATGLTIGRVALAGQGDLAEAAEAADRGFKEWRESSAFERYQTMRRAAAHLRDRARDVAGILTMEQGKPFHEALYETLSGAEVIDWFAEEARRTYGRVIPARTRSVRQLVVREPIGPVAAFTPWNFPINQAVRKVAAALAAGCSVILKGPEETPASCAALVQVFVDAGMPRGVLNLVFGKPAEVSEYLIAHPAIRKVSFTGSTSVGKHLAMLAGKHMKRSTMELGGHAPAIVFADADVPRAAAILATAKYFNAGQVCISPTRLLVEETVADEFAEHFVAFARSLKVGDGLNDDVQMGPLANTRRVVAMERLVADARERGAQLLTGGARLAGDGCFFSPTVLLGVPIDALIMSEEPFGPVAPISTFGSFEEVITEANRLSYGLAAYAFTRSSSTSAKIADGLECGMVSINHFGLGDPETPFGGVKESGFGSEGGVEAMEPYLLTKFISEDC